MSALLDSLASGFEGTGVRRDALTVALADGLPTSRAERWKYSSLRALERRTFAHAGALPAAVDPAILAAIPAPRLVFVNGRMDAALSALADLPEGLALRSLAQALAGDDADPSGLPAQRFERADETFARLNAALANDGALLSVAEGARIAVPIHLVFIGSPATVDIAWHTRSLIELQRGATLALVEHHFATGNHAHLANERVHVHLAAGAQLQHARIQDEASHATLIARTDAVLARDAGYRRIDLELGAAMSRHELNVRLEGERAKIAANGVLLANGRQHIDTRLDIQHIARDTACDLVWRGLACGRGRAVFHGGISIRAGADGSDARLSNKNLLLSEGAEIDTQPVLEIHADEVKAAHGATVGRLDETALFYLRSRGLPAAEARRMLTTAFCREPVAVVGDAAVIETLAARLDAALARLDVA